MAEASASAAVDAALANAQPQVASRGIDLLMIRERQRLDVQAMHEKLLALLQELPADVKHKNANQFFKVVSSKEKSQQVRVECMACGHSMTSTGSSRLVKHIVMCALMPKDIKKTFLKLTAQTESNKAMKRGNEKLMEEEDQVAAADHAAKQAKLVQLNVRAGLKSLEVAEADLAIAKFFYANGLSFGAASAEQGSYYREMVRKIQAAPFGYIPPNRNKIAGPLVDHCYDWMWKKIEERDPTGERAMRYCSCYVSDGWDSVDNLPLINSAFITGNDGGVYWRSVDTSGKEKNAEFCAALMIADIYEYGPHKVLLVITDTCTTMRKCWGIVMDEFPWRLMVLPCQAHVLSLLMKDIGKAKKVCLQ